MEKHFQENSGPTPAYIGNTSTTQKQTNSNVITPSLLAQKRYHATQLNLESKVLALTTRLARAVRPKLAPGKVTTAYLVSQNVR